MWPKRYVIHDTAIEGITEQVELDGDYEEAFNAIEKNLMREHSPDLIRSNMDVRFPEDGASMINLLKRDGILRCKLDCHNLTVILLSGDKMLVGCDRYGVCTLNSTDDIVECLMDENTLGLAAPDASFLAPILQIIYRRVFTFRYGDMVDEAKVIKSKDSVRNLTLTWQKDDDTISEWDVIIVMNWRLEGTFIGIYGVGAWIASGSPAKFTEEYMVEKLSLYHMDLPKHITTKFCKQIQSAIQ